MTSMQVIRGCPLCGEQPKTEAWKGGEEWDVDVFCGGKGHDVTAWAHGKTEKTAVKRAMKIWNGRV